MKCTTGRGTVLAIAMAVALTGTAACTSSESSEPSGKPTEARRTSSAHLDALRSAERATERAASARVRTTTVMGSQLSIRAEGVLGWGDHLTGTATITYTGGTTAETMRDLGVTSMRARYLSDAYYAHLGDAFARRIDGRHWLKYAYKDLEALDGGGVGFADQMRNTTPDESVKLLMDAEEIREVGEESVDGQRVTHYSGTVRVQDVTDTLLKTQLQQAGVTSQTVDIWIDDRNLLVKKVEQGQMATGRLTQTVHYSDYGVKVSVERPPAADTQDFRDLLSKKNGAAGDS
ncbi:hypothetical protein [Streptomyces sp. YU58]|uniref:hypothetical protein n=1 Tax=Streptomyces sp. SX92 TaxID=3158972 RepID=UPI0027B9A011|nr:hypothetical protein [Streptomyces coralus]WLW52918.1 hypothetical protein QU709_16675 [Streptomyces coralus]